MSSIEAIKFTPTAKTLEEYVLNELAEAKREIASLKAALDGAKHTIAEMQKANADVWNCIKPEFRKAAAYNEYIIDFHNIWEKEDAELFPAALKLFGFEEEYKKARQDDEANE